MKRIALLLILGCQVAIAGMWVAPAYVGNDLDDSVLVTFCTFDTTYYPTITDADSIIALRFGPDNSLVDSLTQNAANLFIPRTGWYEIHYRGADASGNQGLYRVYVRAKVGGDWRGAGSVNYQVI
ncbi:MAG: hypothetical protein KAT58_11075, partial [candidate division Zixibacteria bacterium]|nr:hypothetical protein [candidate division Zixibacteria bacterium]